MAVGFTKDGNEQQEIESAINAGVAAARKDLFKSSAFCIECTGIIFRSHRAKHPKTVVCHKCHKD